MNKKVKEIIICISVFVICAIIFFFLFWWKKHVTKRSGEYQTVSMDLSNTYEGYYRKYVDSYEYSYIADVDNNSHFLGVYNLESGEYKKHRINSPAYISRNEGNDKEYWNGRIAANEELVFLLFFHAELSDGIESYHEFRLFKYNQKGEYIEDILINVTDEVEIENIYCDSSYLYCLMKKGDTYSIDIYSLSGEYIEGYEYKQIPQIIEVKSGGILCKHNNQLEIITGREKKNIDIKADILIESEDEKYDFVYYNKKKLYGFNILNGKSSIIFKGEIERIENCFQYNDEKLYRYEWYDAKHVNLLMILLNKKQEVDSRETLYMATVNANIPYDLVNEFNTENKDYKIEVIYFESQKELMTYLGEGKTVDIYDLSGLDSDNMYKKGLLCNLYPKLKRDGYLESISNESLKCISYSDDEVCYISPGFFVETFIENVTDEADWDLDRLMNIAENDAQFYDSKVMLLYLYAARENLFFDRETKKVYFQTDEAKRLLEYTGYFESAKNMNSDYYANCMDHVIKDGGAIQTEIGIRELRFIIDYNNKALNKIHIVGYPKEEKPCSYFFPTMQIGIGSGSDHQEISWSFVKKMLTYEYGLKYNYANGSFPIRTDCLAEINALMCSEETINHEIIGTVDPKAGGIVFSFLQIDNYTDVPSVEEIEKYEMVLKELKPYDLDYSVYGIILEEMEPYWAGQKGIDDVCRILDGRVKTYLNE